MALPHALKVAAALGTLSSAAWVSTFAAFSDSGTATSGSFTTGTLDLKLDGADSSTLTSLALPNAKPGDVVYAPLVLSSPSGTSSLAMTYGMTTVATGNAALGAALQVGVRSGVTDCSAAGYLGSGTSVVASGTALASATVSGRSLASGATETLCFQLSLPSSVADNALQGKTAGATFTFTATT